jgi:PAS domain S-box-containing protein
MEGSAVDITDRKRTEQALKESERMFRVLAETAPVGIYIYQDDRIVYANQRAFGMAGLERSIGIDLRDYLHPEDRKQLDRIAPAIVAGDLMDEQYEMRIILDSGEMRWVLLKGQAIKFDGRPAAMGITVDITEQKRAVGLIEEAKSQLSAIVENTDDFILLSDENAKPVYFNSAYARVMKELIGLDMKPGIQPHTLLPDPAERAVWDGFHKRVLGGEKFSVEHHMDTAGGLRRHFRTSFHPIRQEGRIVGFSEYTNETTSRKQAVQALTESEEKFRLLAEQSFDAIFLQDLDGTITYVSGSCERVTGYTEAELLGRNPIDLVDAASGEVVATAFENLAVGVPMTPTELVGICPDGSERDLEVTASPIVKDGMVTGIQAVLRDITKRKRAERRLAHAFEEQSLHLRQVAGGLAHDVYNDLFPMTASLHKLRQRLQGKENLENERDLRIIGMMERGVRRALDLVESVNLYSRMDRISVGEGADLSRLVADCLEQNRERLEALSVTVTNRVPEEIRIRCSSGPGFHLINNLVVNAIDALESVDHREISIEAEAVGDKIRIRLSDTGAGIKPNDLPRIFDPFFSTKPRSGTGLGLAIVKRVVDLCQGEIEVESSLDKGTGFRILLPGNVGT